MHMEDLDDAARFMIESAKAFGKGKLSFLDREEFARIKELYGSMETFPDAGKELKRGVSFRKRNSRCNF